MEANADLTEAVSKLLDRLDGLERKVDHLTNALGAVTNFSGRADLLAEAAGDSAAHFWSQAEAKGIDPVARGFDGLNLAARVTAPDHVALVHRLLDQKPALDAALNAAEDIDAADLETVITQGAATVSLLAKVLSAPEFKQLLQATPDTLDVAAKTSTALVSAKSNVAPVGPIGAVMKMRDPDVQKAVGFGLALAKSLGSKL